MNRHNRGNHRGRNQSNRRTLYLRATAVVASPTGILLVKHSGGLPRQGRGIG